MKLKGCDGLGPDDPQLIMVLFNRGGGDSGRPDPVASHHDRMLLSGLIQVHRLERGRIFCPELEDIAYLDDPLDTQTTLAVRTPVPTFGLMDVGPPSLKVGARYDPTQVEAAFV